MNLISVLILAETRKSLAGCIEKTLLLFIFDGSIRISERYAYVVLTNLRYDGKVYSTLRSNYVHIFGTKISNVWGEFYHMP